MTVNLQVNEDVVLQPQLNISALEGLIPVAKKALEILDKTNHDVSIVIMTDEQITDLNASYRGVEGPTDVLSFAAEPPPPGIEIDDALYLGDLLLAYTYTLQRAINSQHHPADEFGLLVVHGILHLCGYNHDSNASQQIMWQKQREILQQVNIFLDVPDYIHETDDPS